MGPSPSLIFSSSSPERDIRRWCIRSRCLPPLSFSMQPSRSWRHSPSSASSSCRRRRQCSTGRTAAPSSTTRGSTALCSGARTPGCPPPPSRGPGANRVRNQRHPRAPVLVLIGVGLGLGWGVGCVCVCGGGSAVRGTVRGCVVLEVTAVTLHVTADGGGCFYVPGNPVCRHDAHISFRAFAAHRVTLSFVSTQLRCDMTPTPILRSLPGSPRSVGPGPEWRRPLHRVRPYSSPLLLPGARCAPDYVTRRPVLLSTLMTQIVHRRRPSIWLIGTHRSLLIAHWSLLWGPPVSIF